MPPPAVADVTVDQSVELAAEPLPLAEPLAELEELELLQPAASRIDPTAATDATIAFDARKVKPSPCRPQEYRGRAFSILARQVVILAKRVEQTVTGR
jgi:hypothetical protein